MFVGQRRSDGDLKNGLRLIGGVVFGVAGIGSTASSATESAATTLCRGGPSAISGHGDGQQTQKCSGNL